MEFTTPQAATATKHSIENHGATGSTGRKHTVNYTNPHANPFRTLPKDAPMRKENNRTGPAAGFNSGNNQNMNFSSGGMGMGGGGYRGRGGFNNNRGMGGNMGNFNNRNNFNSMGGFQGGAGPSGGMMGGFQGAPMGGMQNYGFNNRGGAMGGGMMGGGMRGGPGGMRGGRGGGNMGGSNMMGMPGMNPMGGMGMNPMAGGMNPMMGGMGGNMGMQGEFLDSWECREYRKLISPQGQGFQAPNPAFNQGFFNNQGAGGGDGSWNPHGAKRSRQE